MSHLDSLPPDQQESVKKLLAETKKKHEQLMAELPEEVRRLGNVIRMSLKFGTTRSLERYLRKLGFQVDRNRVEQLRDVLILNRSDLLELAPAARQRLRVVYLRDQPGGAMTEDFAMALHLASGIPERGPRCGQCQHFGHAPADEGPEAKPCIALGARGTDLACFGFTRILQP